MEYLPLKPKKDITKRASKSKLNDLELCPKKYWFGQYYPEYNKGSPQMKRGSEIHEILYYVFKIPGIEKVKTSLELFQTIIKKLPIIIKKKLEIMQKKLVGEVIQLETLVRKINQFKKLDVMKYQKEIKLFCNWQEENGFIIPESCEEKVYDKELDMVFIWDRVDYNKGKRIMLDYKTGKQHPIKKFENELLAYAYEYMKRKKLRIDYAGIYFVDHGFCVYFEVTKELIQNMLVHYIMENKDEMKDMQRTGVWPCKKNFTCGPNKAGTYDGCPWNKFCSGYNKKW